MIFVPKIYQSSGTKLIKVKVQELRSIFIKNTEIKNIFYPYYNYKIHRDYYEYNCGSHWVKYKVKATMPHLKFYIP